MAIHSSLVSLLKESIPEYLKAAEYCVKFQKDIAWGNVQTGGCLGFPAASLMFCIADSIGSYYRGNKQFNVFLDGRYVHIRNDSFSHFFIFNSSYYNLALSEVFIKKLYNNYRSLLLHNASIAVNHCLFQDDSARKPFVIKSNKIHVNVAAFLEVTRISVSKFMEEIDMIVPDSEQAKIIHQKR